MEAASHVPYSVLTHCGFNKIKKNNNTLLLFKQLIMNIVKWYVHEDCIFSVGLFYFEKNGPKMWREKIQLLKIIV